MPATEQTWRDLKLMHAIFAASCVAMFVVTVWMFAADHRREWKQVQRQFRNVESWTLQAREAQKESRAYLEEGLKIKAELAAAQKLVPAAEPVQRFAGAAGEGFERAQALYDELKAAGEEERADVRRRFVDELQALIKSARFQEDSLATQRKQEMAKLDEVRSQFDSAVEHGKPSDEIATRQGKVDAKKDQIAQLDLELQDAKTRRLDMEAALAEMIAAELAAKKKLDDHAQVVRRVQTARKERELEPIEQLLTWPIIDAFGRPLKIEQVWLPKLTFNNNFRDVPRFDRCITCHQGIEKTAEGSPAEAAYPHQVRLPEPLTLATPDKAPQLPDLDEVDRQSLDSGDEATARSNKQLMSVYGLQLAERGLLAANDVTVSVVRPESPAAKATLQVGDVIEAINDTPALDRGTAVSSLLETAPWGQPLRISVRRGLPHPFASHPRLDLFVGSLSPHKMNEMGCSICHEGQGSATQFKWVSHTPNTPQQAEAWQRDHGWFNNHHWIYPMMPKRFAQSTCLKCHHDLFELEPSERFPDPPAPKLLAGYNIIRTYGCFGCHEINGFNGPNLRIGPDVRLEPNYVPAAQGLASLGALTPAERGWVQKLTHDPDDRPVRRRLLESLRNANTVKDAGLKEDQAQKLAEVRRSGDAQRLIGLLDDVETPGQFRRVGPSLRHLAAKVDFGFLYAWIRNPLDFRSTTRMPRFFGLNDHLKPTHDEQVRAWEAKVARGEASGQRPPTSLELSRRYEPLEIRAASEYLLAKSQPFEAIEPVQGTAEASAERGKTQFRNRGCLACHTHSDFPTGKAVQGPDLSAVGAKLGRLPDQQGGKWLYTWLKNPSLYHARTIMPDMKLDPVKDEKGEQIDPAADIAAYLLASGDWKPAEVPQREKLTDAERQALSELTLEALKASFTTRQAEEILKSGIPASKRNGLKGDEVELVVDGPLPPNQLAKVMETKQLQYLGRRTISRFGCAGCHDIPGFEDAKPIGTGLADWGRKTPDRLAFDQIDAYLAHGHGGQHGAAHGEAKATETDPDTAFYEQALANRERVGFLWQKLREPRSYDFAKTENKPYTDRLRMPQFNLTQEQREAVATFVLGLVAEPPAREYLYYTSPRRRAVVEGQKLVDKFNCGGCHILRLEEWKVAFDPPPDPRPDDWTGFPDAPKSAKKFDFLKPHFTPEQLAASLRPNVEGKLEATLIGLPSLNPRSGTLSRLDDEGSEIEADDTETKQFGTRVELWQDTLIGGKAYHTGIDKLVVPNSVVAEHRPPLGGDLARAIMPDVVADALEANPQAKVPEAWGWLPPPLVGEGKKVQADWLHDFLLDPHEIRPAAVLRMPKFNMSSAEATALVNYFAALDGAEFPYEYDPQRREEYLAAQEKARPKRFDDALNLLTKSECAKCHKMGDYSPEPPLAPQLTDVERRLRPEYVHQWVGEPTSILPFTGMPAKFKPGETDQQDLFRGSSEEQLLAVKDLLLNFDHYVRRQVSIKPLIKVPVEAAAGNQPADKPADEDKETSN